MHKILTETAPEISGVSAEETETDAAKISHIKITTEEGADLMQRPVGNYITISAKDIAASTPESEEKLSIIIKDELQTILDLHDDTSILAVGLGNSRITSDALGPEVISRLIITSHLFSYLPGEQTENFRSVSALAPSVLGTTGIETAEIIKGITDKISPDIIIAIDSLAAGNVNRIASTVQISDTGISPGVGIGNKRHGLNKEYLGVPVIAIGMPTVIYAANIASDAIGVVLNNTDQKCMSPDSLLSPDEEKRLAILKENTNDLLKDFVVTPKDIDLLIDKSADIISCGINLALHKNISISDVRAFLS